VNCSWVKWGEGLRKRVSVLEYIYSNIGILICICTSIYHMKFAAYMAVSFITFFYILLVPYFIRV